ncbi:hypothetical protein ColKHC_08998 [Colletotrichum higginsianum]|nr:hypothetical protein ColKHC_08998 [Colletotrichum higginsianum]
MTSHSVSAGSKKRCRSSDELVAEAEALLGSTNWKGLPAAEKAEAEKLAARSSAEGRFGSKEELIRCSLSILESKVEASLRHAERIHSQEREIRELEEKLVAKDGAGDALQKSLDEANEKLRVFQAEDKTRRFLIGLGDFWAGINNGFKYYDKAAQDDFEKQHVHPVINRVRGNRLDRSEFQQEVAKRKFSSISGNRVDQFLPRVKAEWQKIRDWIGRDNSEQSKLPNTPLMDRFQDICLRAQFTSVNDYLEVAMKYAERNESAHGGPPDLADFIKGKAETSWDWDGFDRALEDIQKSLVQEYRLENMPQAMVDFMKKTIGLYRRVYISQDTSPASSGWLISEFARESAKDIWKSSEKERVRVLNEVVPVSEYKKGKFDDLDEKVMDRL